MSSRFSHASQLEVMSPENVLDTKWYNFCP